MEKYETVLRIRNCSTYNEPTLLVTHARGQLADVLHMQQRMTGERYRRHL